MSDTISFEKCQTYVDCHLQAAKAPFKGGTRISPSITISRQTGAGGTSLAGRLASWLQTHAPHSACPWTVFDKNLVQTVLDQHDLPANLAQYMPEDKVSDISDAVEELLGLHPASWKLVRQTTQTILQLAELGHSILVGRGSNVITRGLPNVLHLRLVGSPEKRAQRIMEIHKIKRPAALAFLKKTDAGRKRYVRRYLGENIEDPLLYDLTLNTDSLSEEVAVTIVGQLVLRRFYP